MFSGSIAILVAASDKQCPVPNIRSGISDHETQVKKNQLAILLL